MSLDLVAKLPNRLRKNFCRLKRGEQKKMSSRLEVRLSENEEAKLDELIAKSGKSKSEIIKELIMNSRVTDFKMVAKSDEDKDREIQLIATRKWLSILFSNATNNLNQIAHQLNANGIKEKDDLFQEFFNLKNSVEDLKKQIKEKAVKRK